MPTAPPKWCNWCGEPHNGPCEAAKRESHLSTDAYRPNATDRGYDGQWRKARAAHIAKEPLCRMCARKRKLTIATMVDHIVPLVAGGLRLDESNLQSLCARCHAGKTAEDIERYSIYQRRGGG